METDSIVTIYTTEVDSDERSALPGLKPTIRRTVDVGVETICANLTRVVGAFQTHLSGSFESKHALSVEEVELNFAVNGSGQWALLGIGAGVEASVKVLLKKASPVQS